MCSHPRLGAEPWITHLMEVVFGAVDDFQEIACMFTTTGRLSHIHGTVQILPVVFFFSVVDQ